MNITKNLVRISFGEAGQRSLKYLVAHLKTLSMTFVPLKVVEESAHSLQLRKLLGYFVSPLGEQFVSLLLSIVAVTPAHGHMSMCMCM